VFRNLCRCSGGVAALYRQRDDLGLVERLRTAAIIDVARRKFDPPAAIVAERQPVFVDVARDLLPADEGDRQTGGLPRAADEAADRAGAEDCDFWPPVHVLPTSAIRLDPLVRQPQALGRCARLPEDVDRHSAARIP